MHKTIELIGQFPQAGRLAGEQGTRVLPVGRGILIGDSPSYLKK
jgi:hypothetical protein